MRQRLRVKLIERATADETTSPAVDVLGLPHIAFYLIGYGTISSGSITFEESTDDPLVSDQPYGGTWSIIGTATTASDVTGGKQKAIHLAVGAYHKVRARIDTAIAGAGGSISVVLVASE